MVPKTTMAPTTTAFDQAPVCPSNTLRPTKLFIGGLSRHTTTKYLREHFSKGGRVRVLDCVAMRQADGRPRGFGYVTLDSPAEAERILAEPQVVDNRVVDVKLAVPDFQTGAGLAMPPAARRELKAAAQGQGNAQTQMFGWESPDMFYNAQGPPSSEFGAQLPQDSAWPWGPGAPARAPLGLSGRGDLDCLELLSGNPRVPAAARDGRLDCLELLTRTAPALLSAGAPEFVPLAAQAPLPPTQQPRTVTQRPAKMPLRERTNIVDEPATNDDLKALNNFGATLASPFNPYSVPRVGAQFEVQIDPSTGVDSVLEEDEEEHITKPILSTSPSSAGGSGASSPVIITSFPPVGSELPSVGSADHESGECRRCNFFPKGRCQNGASCTFCHMPHEKQKLSRQEKRERKAAAENGRTSPTASTIGGLTPMSQGLTPMSQDHPAPPGLAAPGDRPCSPVFAGMPPCENAPLGYPQMPPPTSPALGAAPPPGLLPPTCASAQMAPVPTSRAATVGTQTETDIGCGHCQADSPSPRGLLAASGSAAETGGMSHTYCRDELLRFKAVQGACPGVCPLRAVKLPC